MSRIFSKISLDKVFKIGSEKFGSSRTQTAVILPSILSLIRLKTVSNLALSVIKRIFLLALRRV